MRIDNVYNPYKLYSANITSRSRRSNDINVSNKDSLIVSGRAEDFHLARKAVSRVPDVRQGKVDALQMLISSGQYSVAASAVADKILENV